MPHLQFIKLDRDISGDSHAAEDATEVRAWEEDSTCLGAVEYDGSDWHVSASDVTCWTDLADHGQPTWRDALGVVLLASGYELLGNDVFPL